MSTHTASHKTEELSFSKSQIFFYILAILVFGFAAYYFSEIKTDVKLFEKVDPVWLIAAVLAQGATYFFLSLGNSVLLRTFSPNSHLRLRDLWKASVITLFIDQTIPSGGFSGKTFFFSFLKKKHVPDHKALSLIFIELMTFYLTLISIISILLVASIFIKHLPALTIEVLAGGLVASCLLGALAGFLGKGKPVVAFVKKISRIPFLKSILDKYASLSPKESRSPYLVLAEHKAVTAQAMLCQLGVIIVDTLTVYALFGGLGIPIKLPMVFVVYFLTQLIGLLPISPGSLVVYEGSMIFFFTSVGVPFAAATVVTLLYRALSFWLPIPVGFFLYRRWQLE